MKIPVLKISFGFSTKLAHSKNHLCIGPLTDARTSKVSFFFKASQDLKLNMALNAKPEDLLQCHVSTTSWVKKPCNALFRHTIT